MDPILVQRIGRAQSAPLTLVECANLTAAGGSNVTSSEMEYQLKQSIGWWTAVADRSPGELRAADIPLMFGERVTGTTQSTDAP